MSASVAVALAVKKIIAAENDTNRACGARFGQNKIMDHRLSSSLASVIITIIMGLRAIKLVNKDLQR